MGPQNFIRAILEEAEFDKWLGEHGLAALTEAYRPDGQIERHRWREARQQAHAIRETILKAETALEALREKWPQAPEKSPETGQA